VTRLPLAVLTALLPALPARAADAPAVGATQTLPAVSVAVAVGSTERDARRAVYAPPPGWYVRSHKVEVARRYGAATYAVSTVPAGWAWRADEQTATADRAAAGAAVSAYKVSGGGQAATAQATATAGHQESASSHHVLVVDVAARGAGLWQGGGGIDLTVVVELVYLGK
jgi:hypothetical protein